MVVSIFNQIVSKSPILKKFSSRLSDPDLKLGLKKHHFQEDKKSKKLKRYDAA